MNLFASILTILGMGLTLFVYRDAKILRKRGIQIKPGSTVLKLVVIGGLISSGLFAVVQRIFINQSSAGTFDPFLFKMTFAAPFVSYAIGLILVFFYYFFSMRKRFFAMSQDNKIQNTIANTKSLVFWIIFWLLQLAFSFWLSYTISLFG